MLRRHGRHSDLGAFGEELAEREELVYGFSGELKKHQQIFLDMSILILEGGVAPDCIGEGLRQTHQSMKHQVLGVEGGKTWRGGHRLKWYMLVLFLIMCIVIAVLVLLITRPRRAGHQ